MNMSLQDAKMALTTRTRHGMNTLFAWLLLWSAFVVMSFTMDDATRRAWLYIAGAALSWALALVIGALLKLDLFGMGSPLTVLYLLLCALQLPFLPLLIGASAVTPSAVPGFLGVIMGVQFLLFAWLFDSAAYLFCSLATLEVAILVGWLSPGESFTALATPLTVGCVLLISTYFLLREHYASRGSTSLDKSDRRLSRSLLMEPDLDEGK
jgi:hypothetical protein